MANDKRARKKEFRAVVAEREAALRRRRIARLAATGLVVVGVIGFAMFSGRDEGEPVGETRDEPSPAAAAACDAEAPPAADPQQYDEPEQVTQEGVDYAAVIHTSCGDISVDLLEESAPINVNNFVFLATEGYYDGLTFHRVVGNFVIQAGDPNDKNGVPPDGPGYTIKGELPPEGNDYVFGVMAMANTSDPDTAGSQFFIITHLGANDEPEPAGLDPIYSIFGKVERDSYEVIREIGRQPTKGGNDPVESEQPVVPVYIESIEIVER